MRKIVWSPSALADLRVHFKFIQIDSPSRAAQWVERVIRSVERLARFPRSGRIIPEIGSSRYREIIFGEYRLFYEITEREVLVFRVLHSKRLFSEL